MGASSYYLSSILRKSFPMHRFFTHQHLALGSTLELEAPAARHVQVLRMQPGDSITLFNGLGNDEGEYNATIHAMGRSNVSVLVGSFAKTHTEPARAVHLAIGMPANDRMDWLVEKATELGAASIQPVISERSVLRLKAERADKKVAHWRGIAIAASEQCGRNRLMLVHDVATLSDWLKKTSLMPAGDGERLLLSLQQGTRPLMQANVSTGALSFLSGPEGGLSPAEEAAAIACGFGPITLGPRVLRAETAPLAVLSFLSLLTG